jgi:hypothetical protein
MLPPHVQVSRASRIGILSAVIPSPDLALSFIQLGKGPDGMQVKGLVSGLVSRLVPFEWKR